MKVTKINAHWVYVEERGKSVAMSHAEFIARGGKLPVAEDKKVAAKKAIKEAKADGVVTKEEAKEIVEKHADALDDMFGE